MLPGRVDIIEDLKVNYFAIINNHIQFEVSVCFQRCKSQFEDQSKGLNGFDQD